MISLATFHEVGRRESYSTASHLFTLNQARFLWKIPLTITSRVAEKQQVDVGKICADIVLNNLNEEDIKALLMAVQIFLSDTSRSRKYKTFAHKDTVRETALWGFSF